MAVRLHTVYIIKPKISSKVKKVQSRRYLELLFLKWIATTVHTLGSFIVITSLTLTISLVLQFSVVNIEYFFWITV